MTRSLTHRAELIAALTLLMVLTLAPVAFGVGAAGSNSMARSAVVSSGERGRFVAQHGVLAWPVSVSPGRHPPLLQPFRAPAQSWSAGHRGVDVAAAEGTPVLAPADGVVTFAGTVVDRGVVTIGHDRGGAAGLRSSVEPVQATVLPGEAIARGQQVGVVARGGAGHCARDCLHWGLRQGRRYLDPMLWVARPPHPVLLPLAEP